MSTLLKPSQVFQRYVTPAYTDYLQRPLSDRHARIAARAIDDQLDWTFEYYKRSDISRLPGDREHGTFRSGMFDRCPELRIMGQIADVTHHRFLEPRKIKRAIDTATGAFTEVNDELWIAPMKIPFLPALTAAVDFWRVWTD